jgi:xylan 1,4-beta-xylosidase
MLAILSCDNGEYSEPFAYVKLPESGKVWLKMEGHFETVTFLYSLDGVSYKQYGKDCDALRISDEHIDTTAFTGAFIGICVQDMSGFSKYADFEYFEYIEK